MAVHHAKGDLHLHVLQEDAVVDGAPQIHGGAVHHGVSSEIVLPGSLTAAILGGRGDGRLLGRLEGVSKRPTSD